MRLHKYDNNKKSSNKSGLKKNTGSDGGDKGENATSFVQRSLEKRCFVCATKEHLVDRFPHKANIARNQWCDRTNREYDHHQSKGNGDDDALVASDADVSIVSSTSAAEDT